MSWHVVSIQAACSVCVQRYLLYVSSCKTVCSCVSVFQLNICSLLYIQWHVITSLVLYIWWHVKWSQMACRYVTLNEYLRCHCCSCAFTVGCVWLATILPLEHNGGWCWIDSLLNNYSQQYLGITKCWLIRLMSWRVAMSLFWSIFQCIKYTYTTALSSATSRQCCKLFEGSL